MSDKLLKSILEGYELKENSIKDAEREEQLRELNYLMYNGYTLTDLITYLSDNCCNVYDAVKQMNMLY